MASPTVCMLTASFAPALGGTERQCWLLSDWLARAGVQVAVLTRGDRRAKGPGAPFPVHRLPAGTGLGYAVAGACWLAARGGGIRVLHAHQALSAALAAVLAKRLRRRHQVVVKVACSGDWSDFRLARSRPFYRSRIALLRDVDRFVVLNQESAAELRAVGLGMVPTCLVPNGVDARRHSPVEPEARSTLRARLGLPPDEPVALFVGRLERRKGLDLLLEAWAELRRRRGYPLGAPRLLIAGPGNLRPWLSEASTRDLGDRIAFLGERQDVADLYRAADLFVFPSRAEGCPNALLEAMASALPVVVTDVPGNREVVGEPGKAGWLVPTEDPAALAEAVGALVGDPALRRGLGAAGRAEVLERFDIHRVGARYLSLYEELNG
jgi:glycosyltransferase involved in cell wall biosynthesis